MYKKQIAITGALMSVVAIAFAATTSTLLPTGAGAYSAWTPSTGSTHYTLVDESSCNGTTDYVTTSTVGARDSYSVDISIIPDGSTITNISVTPCASKSKTSGSAVMNVFYRLNGSNSADAGAYSLSGNTPVTLATTNYSGLSNVKTSTTTLEIGSVYTSGSVAARLSRMATVVTYTLPITIPNAPSNMTATVGTSSYVYLNWTDNSTNENGFYIERSTDGVNFNFFATTTSSAKMDMSVSSGTYYYQVRAYNTAGDSAFSNTATVNVP